MPPLALLALQIASSFVVVAVLAITVVLPRLSGLPRERAVVPLLWAHALRYVPLALLAPGQTGPGVPLAVARTIAWGDFAAAVLAVAAIVALHARGAAALSWVWAFTIVGTLDIVVALATGLGSGVYQHSLGVGWYVLTVYVPIVCVTQAMIAAILVRRRPARARASAT